MSDKTNRNEKKGIFSMIFEDLGTILMIMLRGIIAVLLIFAVVIPVIYFLFKIISFFFIIPMKGYVGDLIVFLLTIGTIFLILFLRRNKSSKIADWVMTGHIEIEFSDENNRKMRALWLKTHKGKERTKPVNWKISLNSKTDFYILETIYPVDKYGHEEKGKAPLYYRTLVPVTHKFLGNLPVKGDTIHFSWTTASNNDIKRLHVRAVEYIEKNPSITDSKDKWIELDENKTAGIICAQDIKTGKKTKISGTVKLSEKAGEKIQLCFWYMPDEAEGESVLREKF